MSLKKHVPRFPQDAIEMSRAIIKKSYRMVAWHSIERVPRTIREFISSLSHSLALASRMRALVVSRATTTGVAPRGEHTRLYGFMYQKWWVHLFVISSCFCFYRDFIYDRIAEPQICNEIDWRFVRRRTYVRLHLRSFVRPSVHPFAGPVRLFVYSFSSIISRRFYIHYNLRG